jgi:hypothetical protein
MALREVGPGGVIRLRIDPAFKARLNRLVQSRYANDPKMAGEARARFFGHPYLVNDPWVGPAQDHIRARGHRCRGMLEGMKARLRRGELRQLGLESATGQTQLTVDKLTDRAVRLLDVDDNLLLLTVPRHPFGGSAVVLEQWWLYRKDEKTLELLLVEEIGKVETLGVKVQSGGGPWRDADESAEQDFFAHVETLLGKDAVDVLKRMSQVQEGVLCHANDAAYALVREMTGIDVADLERRAREAREAVWRRQYGAPPGPPGVSLAVDARIRLGFAREDKIRRGSASEENS